MVSTVLYINFNDFKELIGNRRLFYFVESEYYDFYFMFDGMVIKSTVMKSEIDNKEKFFSDTMFYKAKRLLIQIPTPSIDNITNIDIIKREMKNIIEEETPSEVKDEDIQRVGVNNYDEKRTVKD